MTRLIKRLTVDDAAGLDCLRRAYAAEMSDTGAEDQGTGFASTLLSQPHVLAWGAFVDGGMVAFAIVFRLPEAITGRWCGLLDDLFVSPQARRRGLARELLETAHRQGKDEGWTHLRWLVPEADAPAIALYRGMAEEAPWNSFVMRY